MTTSATQEITARITRTIQVPSEASQGDQYDKYEPLTAEVTIREFCPKKKYDERLDELLDLASEKVFGYLDSGEEQLEGEEIQADGGEGDELLEEGGEFEEGQGEEGGEEGQGGEGFEETGYEEGGEFEEGGGEFEEGQGEEGGEEGGGEGGGDEEFGDFFDDDPGGEAE